MAFRLHSGAEREYHEAIRYYARDSGPGRAFRFELSVEKTLRLLRATPTRSRIIEGNIRKRPLPNRFPFDVIFVLEGRDLRVLAVAHHRRRPGYWRGRLTDENAP